MAVIGQPPRSRFAGLLEDHVIATTIAMQAESDGRLPHLPVSQIHFIGSCPFFPRPHP